MKKTFIFALTVLALSWTACASDDKPAEKADSAKANAVKADSAKGDTTKAVDAKLEFVTTKDGLQYRDDKVGTGAEAATGKRVSMHYTVWLFVDGKKSGDPLDSSIPRGTPYPVMLGAGEVIKGWDLGIVGMKVGGKRTLIVPGPLAYGEQGRGSAIPPNSTLIFDLELMDVK